MKSAIFIADNETQFVLIPETSIDKNILDQLEKDTGFITYRGSFFECQGGWSRLKVPWITDQWGYKKDLNDYALIFRKTTSQVEP